MCQSNPSKRLKTSQSEQRNWYNPMFCADVDCLKFHLCASSVFLPVVTYLVGFISFWKPINTHTPLCYCVIDSDDSQVNISVSVWLIIGVHMSLSQRLFLLCSSPPPPHSLLLSIYLFSISPLYLSLLPLLILSTLSPTPIPLLYIYPRYQTLYLSPPTPHLPAIYSYVRICTTYILYNIIDSISSSSYPFTLFTLSTLLFFTYNCSYLTPSISFISLLLSITIIV